MYAVAVNVMARFPLLRPYGAVTVDLSSQAVSQSSAAECRYPASIVVEAV